MLMALRVDEIVHVAERRKGGKVVISRGHVVQGVTLRPLRKWSCLGEFGGYNGEFRQRHDEHKCL